MKVNRIKDITKKILSNHWGNLWLYTFQYKRNDGEWIEQKREIYDKGDGAAILLYNVEKKTVILTRQFRMPAYINEESTGMQIEVCAGLLDNDAPITCAIREAEEETGYKPNEVEKVFEAFMTPGAVNERLHFFIGQYDESMKISEGGGVEDEQEDIEVLEMPFEKAYSMIKSGEILDAKTILLLQYAKVNQIM